MVFQNFTQATNAIYKANWNIDPWRSAYEIKAGHIKKKSDLMGQG